LFDSKRKFTERLRMLVVFQQGAGREPETLSTKETKEMFGHLEPSWFETIIVNDYYFNSLVGIAIIVVTLNALKTSWGGHRVPISALPRVALAGSTELAQTCRRKMR
jgi:hypothetical protein